MTVPQAVFLIVGILVMGRVLIAWKEWRLLFPRSKVFLADPADDGLAYEDVWFCAEDGANLHGWWFPHQDARGVMLICHGNAGNISDRIWIPQDLQDVPLHKFLFDYRGYGKSCGYPSEKGTGKDVRAALECIRQRWQGATPVPVLLYGRSLGGGIAMQVADAPEIRGVILESTFTSILEIGERDYPWLFPRLFCLNRYRSDLRIEAVRAPVLVAHSADDEVIPVDMGETLFRLAPNPWRFVPLTGSHDMAGWQTSPEYAAAVRAFFAEVMPAATSAATSAATAVSE